MANVSVVVSGRLQDLDERGMEMNVLRDAFLARR